jgi:hypothetical protein
VIWHRWEDFINGLYDSGLDPERQALSAALLRDPEQFRETAREMLRAWPVAARHNLRSMLTSRNAWLGQATCCYAHKATSADTRQAWGMLTNAEQRSANDVAANLRETWEREQQDAQAVLDF